MSLLKGLSKWGHKDRENRGISVEYQHTSYLLGSLILKIILEYPARK